MQSTARTPPAPALPLSAFVICRDEEAGIEACLKSLAGCAEIVVVDSGSTDGTLVIIARLMDEGLPIRLLHRPWPGFAAQKQFALEQTTQPWCLSLDADERLDDDLRRALPALLAASPAQAGWRLRRACRPHGDGPPRRGVYAKPLLRLVRRTGAAFDDRALVHEGISVTGTVRTAPRGVILHAARPPFVEQIRIELTYAQLKATARVRDGLPPSRLRLVFNPPLYFIRLFLLHRWFLCGRAGFVHAMTGAIYAFAAETMHFDASRQAACAAQEGPQRSASSATPGPAGGRDKGGRTTTAANAPSSDAAEMMRG